MTGSFSIRTAEISDMPAILKLVQALADYEKEPEAVTVSVSSMEADFKAGYFEAEVLEYGAEVIGILVFHTAYSTWRGRVLYLEDFYVDTEFRGKGLGKALFQRFIQIGQERDCKQLRWQVLDWNTPAIQFYKSQMAIIQSGWLNGRIYFTQ